MARAPYNETICSIDTEDGTLKAAANVQVTVRMLDDDTIADIWENRTGTAPADEKENPFLTRADGAAQFFAESGRYKVEVHDMELPARIGDDDWEVDLVAGDISPEDLGFALGDIKLSANNLDHGRWLKMDGRELTQAEVEGALSLSAGDAADFVAFLGTGAGSKYGAAAGSKIKLADTRRRVLMGAGASTGPDTTPAVPAGLTARPLGNNGGVEVVTLSAAQSGLRQHDHGAGTLVIPAHSHSGSGLYTVDHCHANWFNTGAPGSTWNSNAGAGSFSAIPYNNHIHLVAGNTGGRISFDANDPSAVYGSTGSTPSATAVSGRTSTEGNVSSTGGSAANQSHDNMPPFVSVGYLFIRV